jgi:hypothetical protein
MLPLPYRNRDPERIRAGLDQLIEEERTGAGRDPKRDAEVWSRKLTEVEVERRGYHRLAAKGHMTDQELVAALSELNEIRETAERELEAVRARGEALERLEHDRDTLMESYAGMVGETLEETLHPRSATTLTSCSGSASAFAPTGPWRS